MRIEFPSIANPEKYLFVYDTEQYQSAPISGNFLYRIRRHDNSWQYPDQLSISLFGEYLASLASVMIDNDDLCRSLKYRLDCGPEIDRIKFAAKVVYKEGKKKKYYSLSLARVSAVNAKQYDRRFEPIAENMNGSPESIMNLLFFERGYMNDGLSKFAYAVAIYKWANNEKKYYRKFHLSQPAIMVKFTESYNEAYAIQSAWDACIRALDIWKMKNEHKSDLEQYVQYAMVNKLEQ
jgi:hypothetical protein